MPQCTVRLPRCWHRWEGECHLWGCLWDTQLCTCLHRRSQCVSKGCFRILFTSFWKSIWVTAYQMSRFSSRWWRRDPQQLRRHTRCWLPRKREPLQACIRHRTSCNFNWGCKPGRQICIRREAALLRKQEQWIVQGTWDPLNHSVSRSYGSRITLQTLFWFPLAFYHLLHPKPWHLGCTQAPLGLQGR